MWNMFKNNNATLSKSHFGRRPSGVFMVNFEHNSHLFLVL